MKYENNIKDLKAAFGALTVKHTFKPGDIVQWKDGLQNKNGEGPFVVIEVLPRPVFDTSEPSGGAYFREPLDILLGTIGEVSGKFLIYHYDSRRFEPVESK